MEFSLDDCGFILVMISADHIALINHNLLIVSKSKDNHEFEGNINLN